MLPSDPLRPVKWEHHGWDLCVRHIPQILNLNEDLGKLGVESMPQSRCAPHTNS